MEDLIDKLKKWADKYETPKFIENDPIQFPRKYKGKCLKDVEISAFVTTWVCMGKLKMIIDKAKEIDRDIFKEKPLHYIIGTDWNQYRDSKSNFHKYLTEGDFYTLCKKLNEIYSQYENMQEAINTVKDKGTNTKPLQVLQELFGEVEWVPNLGSKSTCKRLSLFLRWMVRKNSPVDLGEWDCFDPKDLLIPLDTHVYQQAKDLGITTRKTQNLKMAEEITGFFRKDNLFPRDPSRGDFALFGHSIGIHG